MDLYLRNYLEYLRNDKRRSFMTVDSYRRDIEKFLSYAKQEGADIQDVDQIIIRNFLQNEFENEISKKSCKRRISAAKGYFHYLAKNGIISDNPFLLISPIKTEKKYPTVLYKEQIVKLFEENRKRKDALMLRDEAIIETLYFSGLRVSEVCGLQLTSIDLSNRCLSVIGKGNKQRIAPFSESCRNTIKEYVDTVRPSLAIKSVNPSNILFLNNSGEKLTSRGVQYILRQIEQKTGIFLGLHPHIFRHSFATHLLENGMDLRMIQELLGHDSINATQIYTHVTDKAMREIYMKAHPRAKKVK